MGITERQKDRTRGVGGSDVGKLMNVSKYGNVIDLWHDKCGTAAPFEGNVHTERGDYLEDAGLAFAVKELKFTKIRRNPERRRGPLLVHLDAQVVGELIAIEVKSANESVFYSAGWGEADNDNPNDKVPVEVFLQCQAQMLAAGNSVTYVSLICPLRSGWFHLYKVVANEQLQKEIMLAAVALWECVTNKVEPEHDGTANLETMALVKRTEGKAVALEEAGERWFKHYMELGKLASQVHAKRDVYKKKLVAHLGDATIGRLERGSLKELALSTIKGRVTRGKGKNYPDDVCESCGVGTRTGTPSVRLGERNVTKVIEAPKENS